jgi:hypothetical protein
MAALSYQESAKEITDLVEKVVLPSVESAAKALLDGSNETPEDDDDVNKNHLCGRILLPTRKLTALLFPFFPFKPSSTPFAPQSLNSWDALLALWIK